MIAGKYRLIEGLGEGGMAAVWLAENEALATPVAVKLIRADLDNPQAAERLLNEARLAARLGHAAVVRTFDFGTTEHGDPFIVMERLHGESLSEHMEREGRFPATAAVQLLLPIADALAAAHSKGIIHRDLKPDNIFLADIDGRLQPKLLDFGIAKAAAVDTDLSISKLTRAGVVVGSPEYLSPEQARGDENIDNRVDVWAFCIVLYECLTTRVPFSGNNYNSLLRAIIEKPPLPLTELAAGDAELWDIVRRGLAKKREERWSSLRDLGRALARWLADKGIAEDVCGQSLRAGWLEARTSVPDSGSGRFSRDSLLSVSGSSGEGPVVRLSSAPPGPGARADSAPTLAPPPPMSEPQPARAEKRSSKTAAIVMGGLAVAVVGTVAIVTLVPSSSEPAAPTEPAAAAPIPTRQPAAEETTAPTRAETAADPEASASAAPEEREAAAGEQPASKRSKTRERSKPASPSSPPKPAPVAAEKNEPAPKPKPQPKTPYQEDLGF